MTALSLANSIVVNPQPTTGKPVPAAEEPSFFGAIWDTINPLQHIPIVSNIYRSLTGDSISSVANIAGGALYGGPIGAGMAAVSEVAKAALGEIAAPEKTAFAEESTDTATVAKANDAYQRMRVTTADWLNPDFGGNTITV